MKAHIYNQKKYFSPTILAGVILTFLTKGVIAQVPTCGSGVPFYQVDLRGKPAGSWESPSVSRNSNCCGTSSPDRCISFEIFLDTGSTGINFEISSGSIPPGSMFYQINCGPATAVGSAICISGAGPHYLTFCKPGNNPNTYKVTSVPKPTFPKNDTTRVGCSLPLELLGFDPATVTINSINPGSFGQYNSYLSCSTGCLTPIFTPDTLTPTYIDYYICGTPGADQNKCGYLLTACDTVRVYTRPEMFAQSSPNPASFCSGGQGVKLTGGATGGDGNYTFKWKNSSGTVLSVTDSFLINVAGTYTLEVEDGLSSATCPAAYMNVPVSAGSPPVVNAGSDQLKCATNPLTYLSGSVQHATGGIWSGGAGTFSPSANNLYASYQPAREEIDSGYVVLTLTSTGAGGGCTNSSDEMTIYFNDTIKVSLSAPSALCHNDSVTITSGFTGGTGPYSYLWSTGATTSTLKAGHGTYTLHVHDSIGCGNLASISISVPAQLTVSMSSTDVSTNGGSDGTATATPSGGVPPYSYLWNSGRSLQTDTGRSYGIATVIITDSNGCSITGSVVVNEPRCLGFSASVTHSDVTCYGGNNSSATAHVSGGSAPYIFAWSDAMHQTYSTATNLNAGSYTLTVTDSNGCVDVASFAITQPAKLTSTITHIDNTVIGGTNGSATANPAGGTLPYSYVWSNSQTSKTITGLTAGNYTVQISDSNNCSVIDSVYIAEPPCNNFNIYTNAKPVRCHGESNGEANVVVAHGTPPYTFSWNTSPIQTNDTAFNLRYGSYTVTVTDSSNCTDFQTTTITEPDVLAISLSATNVSCFGAKNGTIDLTVTGGSFPYSFSWSNGLTVEDLARLSPGKYIVTVTDASGCTRTDSATITQPNLLSISLFGHNVTCNSGSDGYIDATITGGVLPYAFSWTTGDSTEDIDSLPAGAYKLTVTDANSCQTAMSSSLFITQPDVVAISAVNISCPSPVTNTASVSITPSGGNGSSYYVSLNNGTTYMTAGTYSATLPADSSYSILLKDSTGCVAPAVKSIYIKPSVKITSVRFDSCLTTRSATTLVKVTPAGGDGNTYQLSADSGATYYAAGTYEFNLAINHTYHLIAKDSSGCVSLPFTIVIPDTLTIKSVVSDYHGYNISCKGNASGSIDITVTGGSNTYSYLWNNNATSQDLSNLGAGFYKVTVTDNNGCIATDSFTLTEPDTLSIASLTSNFHGSSVSCKGSTNGSIDITVTKGTAPYSYLWNNNATSQDLSNLGAGFYKVTVTDNNGCIATDSFTLTEPDTLSIASLTSNFHGSSVSCKGSTNGSIDITVTKGTAPYSYLWNNNATSQDLSNLGAGFYKVTVTDNNGCIATDSFTLTEPDTLKIASLTSNFHGSSVSCKGSTNGSIDITVTKGTAPYSYLWNNNATSQDLSNLGAGFYKVTVTDNNGCIATDSFTLTEPDTLNDEVVIINATCFGANGSIQVNLIGGTTPYSYSWSNGSTQKDLLNVTGGKYTLTVTDLNGCQLIRDYNVYTSSNIALTSFVVPVKCFGEQNGSIDITMQSGTAPFTFNWSNGAATEDLINIGAGYYKVVVNDAYGCNTSDSFVVTQPPRLTTSLTPSVYYGGFNISRFNAFDGWINLQVQGGTSPYNILWSTGSNLQLISNLPAGKYTVAVSDNNGCLIADSIVLTQPIPLEMPSGFSPNGDGHNDYFVVHGLEAYPVNLLRIFNRWGNEVYTKHNYNNEWNGEDLSNSSLPDGTYFVILDVNNGEITLTGYVDLRRQ